MNRSLPEPARGRSSAPRRATVALVLAAWGLLAGLAPVRADAADSLRIAASRAPFSLPLYVAQQRGFFADEQLDVTITDCIGGTRCLRQVLDDKADLATTSEMPVVLQGFAHADIAIVATVAHASDNLKLIARKASGVTSGDELGGRRVGVIAGTAAQYLLEMALFDVGVDPRGVTMVPLQAEDAVQALRAGRIDAVAVWEPYGYAALHGPDAVGLRLPLGGAYIESYNLVGRSGVLARRDDAMVRLLRAIERAERFIGAQPAASQAILREQLKLDQSFVDWVWGGLAFRLSLDQSLLSTMEGEVRWAQREGHVAEGARPNVLTLVHPGPLRAVKPSAVGIGG
jgi:NitT/TauT family transport system substrate-binding protein